MVLMMHAVTCTTATVPDGTGATLPNGTTPCRGRLVPRYVALSSTFLNDGGFLSVKLGEVCVCGSCPSTSPPRPPPPPRSPHLTNAPATAAPPQAAPVYQTNSRNHASPKTTILRARHHDYFELAIVNALSYKHHGMVPLLLLVGTAASLAPELMPGTSGIQSPAVTPRGTH